MVFNEDEKDPIQSVGTREGTWTTNWTDRYVRGKGVGGDLTRGIYVPLKSQKGRRSLGPCH